MEFSLPEFPTAPGAQAAFLAAAFCILAGLVLLVFPASLGRVLGLEGREDRPGAIGELRAAGGFLAGFALATLMFDQPVLFTGLGIAMALAAFGRILSLMSDQASSILNYLLLLVQLLLAGALLHYFFDVVSPDMQLGVPEGTAARLVFYVYAAVAVIGAFAMFGPRLAAMTTGMTGIHDGGYTSVRSAGGFALGLGLSGMAFVNPMLDVGFAAALTVAAIGRILALVLNRGNYIYATIALILNAAFALVVISYISGMM